MSHQALKRTAWALYGLELLLVLAAIGIHIAGQTSGRLSRPSAQDVIATVLITALQVAYPLLGVIIVQRQPRNPLGWIFVCLGVVLGVNVVADSYTQIASPSLARSLAAWLANLIQGPWVFGVFPLFFLLFPNGRLLGPRWRSVVWADCLAMALVTIAYAFSPGRLQNYGKIGNPVGIGPAHAALSKVTNLAFVLVVLCIVVSAVSLVQRFRRSRGEERLQLKWVATATAIAAVCVLSAPIFWFVVTQPPWLWPAALATAVTTIPVAIAIAMLKYRLYDIDVIINRTLVYGTLTLLLAALYAVQIVVFQAALRAVTGQQSGVAVAVSTLVIAMLFNPLRRRIQDLIERTFYRRRYNASTVLESFGARCRDATDINQLRGDLLRVVEETMQPRHASLWIREAAGSATNNR